MRFFNLFEFTLWSDGGLGPPIRPRIHLQDKYSENLFANSSFKKRFFFYSKNYPRAVALFALQAHEFFFVFGKEIDISSF